MRKFVVGKGHIGSYMAQTWDISPELHWKDDIAVISENALKLADPDVVINTAGKTDLPWCENNQAEAFRCNVIAPLALCRLCARLEIPFIHLSSGCVWDGPFKENGEPFGPNDLVTPACFYTWTKASCDSLMRETTDELVLIRPRQVYSPVLSPRNTLDKLNRYPKLLDTPNSMTSLDTIIRVIDHILEMNTELRYFPDVWNVYDKGTSSPFRVAELLAAAGLRAKPELLEKKDLDKWHKPKRVDTVLYDKFFETTIKPSDVEDELTRVIGLYAKNMRAVKADETTE